MSRRTEADSIFAARAYEPAPQRPTFAHRAGYVAGYAFTMAMAALFIAALFCFAETICSIREAFPHV